MHTSPIIRLCLIVPFLFACRFSNFFSNDPTPTPLPPAVETISTTTAGGFENGDIRLVIPSGWKASYEIFGHPYSITHDSEFDADVLYVIGEPLDGDIKMGAYCEVFQGDLSDGETLDQVMQMVYENVHTNYAEYEFSQQSMNIHGMDAVEKIYQRPWGEPWAKIRDVWFVKDGRFFVLSCRSSPNSYDDNINMFESVLDGFEIK